MRITNLTSGLCEVIVTFNQSRSNGASALNNDPTKDFSVEILKAKNVSHLKKKIKGEKAPHLDDLAVSDLILWKVRLPWSV